MYQSTLMFVRDAVSRHTDPDTAKQAAEVVNTAKLESEVLYSLHEYGPMTAHEIASRIGRPLVSVSPRLRPLANKGKIMATEERHFTASGSKAIVWKVL
jgi:predicted transcriptional regulator